MNKKDEKDITPMEKLTQGYEKFIKGKETNNNGSQLFSKVISKATKPTKQRGSK
jgi:hypothetical protein